MDLLRSHQSWVVKMKVLDDYIFFLYLYHDSISHYIKKITESRWLIYQQTQLYRHHNIFRRKPELFLYPRLIKLKIQLSLKSKHKVHRNKSNPLIASAKQSNPHNFHNYSKVLNGLWRSSIVSQLTISSSSQHHSLQ